MRLAKYLLATEKQAPGDAEIVSHQLLVRAGMIRKVAAGIYTFLPLGLRVLTKCMEIIRREMDRAGAQELLMPALQPAEVWKRSGRWFEYGAEMMRVKDRNEREFCLGPTHEELLTELVAPEVTSWRQLPLMLYQIQTKFRDEIRPRFGIMRVREFFMKDAYSFDRDQEGLEESYRAMHKAYCAIFDAMGLDFRPVEASTGLMGGSFSHEFMVLAQTGEEAIASCDRCDYAANTEIAVAKRAEEDSQPQGELDKVHTPGKMTIDEVSDFLSLPPARLVKTMVYRTPHGYLAVLVRGDREINLAKLEGVVGEGITVLGQEDFDQLDAPFGYVGPVNLPMRTIADEEVARLRNVVVGANEADHHLVNANPGRDFTPEGYYDLMLVQEGEACPRCDGSIRITRGIEVGHLFQLGSKYSESLDATYDGEDGVARPYVMGSYGIGVGRVVAAAIEQNHDERGIIWPPSLAPFEVAVLPLKGEGSAQMEAAERAYRALQDAGFDTVLDDREDTAGVKFADADLIGYPLQVIAGRGVEKGELELKIRESGERRTAGAADVLSAVRDLWQELGGAERSGG